MQYDYFLTLMLDAINHSDIFYQIRNDNSYYTNALDKRVNIRDINCHHIVLQTKENSFNLFIDNIFFEGHDIPNNFIESSIFDSFLGRHLWVRSSSILSAAKFNGYIYEYFLFKRAISNHEINELFLLNHSFFIQYL